MDSVQWIYYGTVTVYIRKNRFIFLFFLFVNFRLKRADGPHRVGGVLGVATLVYLVPGLVPSIAGKILGRTPIVVVTCKTANHGFLQV